MNQSRPLPDHRQVNLPGFTIDLARGELRSHAGELIALRPRSFAVLRLLAEMTGQVVGKDAIMADVWSDAVVTDDSLTQCIADIRRALGDTQHRIVRTVPRRGYVLAATTRVAPETTASAIIMPEGPAISFVHGFGLHPHPAPPPPQPDGVPKTNYARSGDVHIAYQVTGDGPIDLVFVQGYITHLEIEWEDPRPAALYRRLASFCRLIRFDKRGTGLSDRVHGLPSLEERMDDVRAVMDAAGSERAVLLGSSEGGPMSMLFCATYPHRVQSLILYAAMARFAWAPDNPWGRTAEQQEANARVIEEKWGQGHSVDWFAPSVAADPEYRAWRGRLDRAAASPGAAIALARMNFAIDVRHILPAIHVPTLVLHRSREQVVNIAHSHYIATHIPGARLVELPGLDHAPWIGETEALCREIETFARQTTPVAVRQRVLATILSVRWDGQPDNVLRAAVAQEIAAQRGRLLQTTRDGWLAAFDGPARAVRAGTAIVARKQPAQVQPRAGIHIGECETSGTILSGETIDIATRLATAAAPGEVLATGTVFDVVAGTALRLTPYAGAGNSALPPALRVYSAVTVA